MKDHMNVVIKGRCESGEITFPPVDILDGMYGFFPYGMKLGNARLRTALATPLCRLGTKGGDVWVFYGDYMPKVSEMQSAAAGGGPKGAQRELCRERPEDAVFIWEDGAEADILKLSRKEALLAGKVVLDQDYLILSEGFVWVEEGTVRVTGGRETVIRCFPRLSPEKLPGFTECGQEGRFAVYERRIEEKAATVETKLLARDAGMARYEIMISYGKERNRQAGRDTLLLLAYAGDRMEIYAKGEKLNDHFYTGQEVILSLGYFDFPKRLEIVVYPLEETAAVFLEKWPCMEEGRACRLEDVKVVEQYR